VILGLDHSTLIEHRVKDTIMNPKHETIQRQSHPIRRRHLLKGSVASATLGMTARSNGAGRSRP